MTRKKTCEKLLHMYIDILCNILYNILCNDFYKKICNITYNVLCDIYYNKTYKEERKHEDHSLWNPKRRYGENDRGL